MFGNDIREEMNESINYFQKIYNLSYLQANILCNKISVFESKNVQVLNISFERLFDIMTKDEQYEFLYDLDIQFNFKDYLVFKREIFFDSFFKYNLQLPLDLKWPAPSDLK